MTPLAEVRALCDLQTERIRRDLLALVPRHAPPGPRVRTPKRRTQSLRGPRKAAAHGTITRYTRGKCRCVECVAAKRAYAHAYTCGQQVSHAS